MNPEGLTQEQEKNLITWAEQRDSILLEVSILKTEKESLEKINNELTTSNTDIEVRMTEIKGRIKELKTKELEQKLFINKDVSSLQSQKNTLEGEINWLKQMIEVLVAQKTSYEGDVVFALAALNTVKDETSMLDKVVDRVTSVSNDNVKKIDLLVEELGISLAQLIKVNKKNVDETNIVIEKLPKMLMEAQKHGLIKNKI